MPELKSRAKLRKYGINCDIVYSSKYTLAELYKIIEERL
jgi:hypothetical protein